MSCPRLTPLMYYPVCRMVNIINPLLLIGRSSPRSCGSGFPLSLSEWSFTICSTPYNCKLNVLNASLNKTFASVFFCLVDDNDCSLIVFKKKNK